MACVGAIAHPLRGEGRRLTPPADSLDYSRFAQALRRSFPDERIRAIISKLPPNSKVYGYDVGDMSGDSLADVVLSIKGDAESRHMLTVLFFVQTGDGFLQAATLRKQYVGEPIEVGFAVEDGVCRITQKLAEFTWNITGYTIADMVFREVDAWNTHRVASQGPYASYGVETVDDYRTLRSTESYYRMSDARSVLRSAYSTLPVPPEDLPVSSDFARAICDTTYKAVLSGASSWFGADDCSMRIAATQTGSAVELTATVTDERTLYSETLGNSDHLALHFDVSGKPRIAPNGKARKPAPGELLTLRVRTGAPESNGFVPVEIESEGAGAQLRQAAGGVICRRSARADGAADFDFELPRALFGSLRSWGFTAVFHDVDNVEHPDWVTVLATSDAFDASAPETYGRMELLDDDATRFLRDDLRLRDVVARMFRAGIIAAYPNR